MQGRMCVFPCNLSSSPQFCFVSPVLAYDSPLTCQLAGFIQALPVLLLAVAIVHAEAACDGEGLTGTCPSGVTSGWFDAFPKIQYEGPDSKNPLAFHYYNADEVIMGKPMKEWCVIEACFKGPMCLSGCLSNILCRSSGHAIDGFRTGGDGSRHSVVRRLRRSFRICPLI
jgi:hypothetical protein